MPNKVLKASLECVRANGLEPIEQSSNEENNLVGCASHHTERKWASASVNTACLDFQRKEVAKARKEVGVHASAFSFTLRTTLTQLWGPLELSLCNVARLEACTSDLLKGRELVDLKILLILF